MSAQPPAPLDHIDEPDWVGISLIAALGTGDPSTAEELATAAEDPNDTSRADALATAADFGSLASESAVSPFLNGLGMGDIANYYGGAGAAIAQYQKSLLDEGYLYGSSSRFREIVRLAEAAAAGVADTALGNVVIAKMGALVPIVDALLVKPAAWLLDVDFSVGDTLANTFRALAVTVAGDRRDVARRRARVEMGGMGSLPKAALTVQQDGVAQWARDVVKHLRGLH